MRVFDREKIPRPQDFREFSFDPDLPLDIEIGCGVGFHPLRYAQENPGRQLLAFERTSEKFEKFQRRIENHPALPNLFAVHGDAIPWIAHGIKDCSVDRYFILYPNPYPKEGQRNLRFHEMPFFSEIIRTLKPAGQLQLATNAAFYAEGAEKRIQEMGLKLRSKRIVEASEKPRTHFEKKYLVRGERCWDLVFVK